MKIMFEDLTYEAQMRLLAEADVDSPREMAWDIMPVTVVDLKKEGHHLQKNFTDDLYNPHHDVP